MFCEYCKNEFKTISSLNKHINNAKYCLAIQNKKKETQIFICNYCDKNFTGKSGLKTHLISCKDKIYKEQIEFIKNEKDKEIKKNLYIIEKLEDRNNKYLEQIKEQKEHIKELEDRIERLGIKAINKSGNITTNNNNTINMELNNFMSQDYIDNKIGNKFSDKYIINGMKSIAQFVYDHVIRTEDGTLLYGCYDSSRKIFKYKDNTGTEVKDIKAQKLIGLIQPGLKKQTKVLYDFFFLEHEDLEKKETERELDKNERKEKEKMRYLKDKTVEIVTELNEMGNNNKFSNELAILTV